MPILHIDTQDKIYYDDLGPDTSPPVVLLHGWASGGFMWKYQIDSILKAGYRVIVPDFQGHGKSKNLEEMIGVNNSDGSEKIGERIDLEVGHVELKAIPGISREKLQKMRVWSTYKTYRYLVEELGITGENGNPHAICAHSAGGALAQLAAMRWPGDVTSIVLVATAARFIRTELDKLFWETIRRATRLVWKTPLRAIFRNAMGMARDVNPLISYAENALDVDPDTAVAELEELLSFGEITCQDRIECPVLIINGRLDPLVPDELGQELADKIPNAKYKSVPGATHAVLYEKPKILSEMIVEFLIQSHPPRE